MALTKDDALRIAQAFLEQAKRRHEIVTAYVFGSCASGRQRDWSDIDIAVVLGGESATPDRYPGETFEIFHEAQTYNSLLEPICFKREKFEENGVSIIARIKREGIPVAAA